jgi:predicted secreted protein
VKDHRSRRIVGVAHCLLNQNAKVAGLASHPGVFTPLVPLLQESGVGIIQLPCPERVHLGPARPLGTDTVEQYDTPQYRAVCAELARGAVAELKAYRDAGYEIPCVLGVEGSPSCSVSRVPRLVATDRSELHPGRGLFAQALVVELRAAALPLPLLGIPESPETGDLTAALSELRRHLGC